MPVNDNVVNIPLTKISIKKGFNARLKYEGIDELADDIKRRGLLQNLVVAHKRDSQDAQVPDEYDIIAGHRRYMAVTKLGWDEVPCKVWLARELDPEDRKAELAMASLAENVSRDELSPYEIAVKAVEVRDEYGKSGEWIAGRLGTRGRGYVNNLMRIASTMPKSILDHWRDGHFLATVDFLVGLAKYKTDKGDPDHDRMKAEWKAAVEAAENPGGGDDDDDDGDAGGGGEREGNGKSKKGEGEKPGKRPAKRASGKDVSNLIKSVKAHAADGRLKNADPSDLAVQCLRFAVGKVKTVRSGDYRFDPADPEPVTAGK